MNAAQRQAEFDRGYGQGYWHAWYGTTFQSNGVQYQIDFHEGYSQGYQQGSDERAQWANRNFAKSAKGSNR